MTDKMFLTWIRDRLINVHGDPKNADYIIRLQRIIDLGKVGRSSGIAKLHRSEKGKGERVKEIEKEFVDWAFDYVKGNFGKNEIKILFDGVEPPEDPLSVLEFANFFFYVGYRAGLRNSIKDMRYVTNELSLDLKEVDEVNIPHLKKEAKQEKNI